MSKPEIIQCPHCQKPIELTVIDGRQTIEAKAAGGGGDPPPPGGAASAGKKK